MLSKNVPVNINLDVLFTKEESMQIRRITDFDVQQPFAEDMLKEKKLPLQENGEETADKAQRSAEEDIYDLDVQVSNEGDAPISEMTGSSRRYYCSQCACDTAGGCNFSGQSQCGATHCLC
jgi:hypothetical protein